MTDDRMRLDLLLIERKLISSRARAQNAIREGRVRVEGEEIIQPARKIARDARIDLAEAGRSWVSRAALKLEAALDRFALAVEGRTCLDLGASTGGFTELLLARGAARVYAVDVGHGQLAGKLKTDRRVVLLERTNARELTRAHIPEPVDLIVADLSFISLKKALAPALALAAPKADLVALIKPQFEVGKGRIGKGGIVRDPTLHGEVCRDIETWLAAQAGWQVLGVCESPILGGDGNKEFLIAAHQSERRDIQGNSHG